MDAYCYLGLTAEQLGKLSPRKYNNMLEGYLKRREIEYNDMAIGAMMYRRAMNEKRISVDKLLGKEAKVISMDEHKKRFSDAIAKMGPNIIPVKKRQG